MSSRIFESLIKPAKSKIVMIILDGMGGLARESGGKTELETAFRPNLNALAEKSALGLTVPIETGITTGSGPGHLAIFGYDPHHYEIGRGALEVLGVDFDLHPQDLAGRGNFCTVDSEGKVLDRRAGRLSTEDAIRLLNELRQIKIGGVEIFLEPIKEHRFAFVMRAEGLGSYLTDSDPLINGVVPSMVEAVDEDSQFSAEKINQFLFLAQEKLREHPSANHILLRGFGKLPKIPSYSEKFQLRSAAIAINGMYKGVARLAGMDVLEVPGGNLQCQFEVLQQNWADYDFFYLHYKQTDTCGENGDFEGKVKAIEEMDKMIPQLMALVPDVVIIGGDHSTPSVMKSHSWHPVPLMLYGKYVRADHIKEFGESSCAQGSLGLIKAKNVMTLALANAGRVTKYDA